MKNKFYRSLTHALAVIVLMIIANTRSSGQTYCTSVHQFNNCAYYYAAIDKVHIKDSLGTTTIYQKADMCNGGANHYNLMSTNPMFMLAPGKTYNLTVSFGYYYSGYNAVYFAMWIDLNIDGDFDDANEYISSPWGNTANYPGDNNRVFTIPTTYNKKGLTRMRLRSGYQYDIALNSGSSCSSIYYGETEDYPIILQPQVNPDVSVIGINPPSSLCGNSSEAVTARIMNLGTSSVSNIPVQVQLSGTLGGSSYNQTLSTTYSGTLAPFTSTTVTVGTINTNGGMNLQYKAITTYSGDADTQNDTMIRSYSALGQPSNPSPVQTNYDRCGNGTLTLGANASSGEMNLWFDANSGGNLVGIGETYTTPVLTTSKTYYLGRAKFGNQVTDGPGYRQYSNVSAGGLYFDIMPNKTLLLDSLHFFTYYGGTTNLYVYMRNGTFSGNESNASAWTLINYVPNFQCVPSWSINSANPSRVSLNGQVLASGGTYGFMFFLTNTSLYPLFHYNGGTTLATATYNDFTTREGNIVYNTTTPFTGGNFYGTYYGADMFIKYRPGCLNNSRSAVTATVKRVPTGSSVAKGNVFKGTFRSGSIASFDYTKAGDTLVYELLPPTGFANSAYGTSWTISNVKFASVKGVNVPTSYYTVTPPSGSNNATLRFIPGSAWTDSLTKVEITLKNLDPSNLCDSTIGRHIFVAPVPVTNFTKNDICFGERVSFNNLSTISSGTITYFWEFGDGTTSTFTNPEYKYSNFGSYTVKLTVTSNFGYSTTYTQQVNVFEIPNVSFKAVNACAGSPVTFLNSTNIGTGTITYNWTFGDGNTSTSNASTVTHSYATPGQYEVTLQAMANGCVSETKRKAYQFHKPTAAFSSVTECNSYDSKFTSGASIGAGNIGHIWDFGDGERSTQKNPSHVYTTFGDKTVKLKVVSEFGCTDSITQIVNLKEAPKANFTTSPVCTNDPTVFTNTTDEPSTGVTVYKWWFGTGDSTTIANPTYQYPGEGTYVVKLTATNDNGCASTKTMPVQVLVQPTANFIASDVCSGESMKFNNQSTVKIGTELTYIWKFDDGNTSTAISPVHNYSAVTTTTYNATLYAMAKGGCADSITKQVKVNAIPNCSFQIQNTGHKTYVFTAATPAAGVSYHWLFGEGSSSTAANPTHKYDAWGDYTVTLIITSDAGCQCSKQVTFSASTGVQDVASQNGINVYPNPNTGKFNVSFENVSKVKSMGIYNMLGELVQTIDVATGVDNVYSVDMNNIASGVYFVKAETENGLVTKKFTVSK